MCWNLKKRGKTSVWRRDYSSLFHFKTVQIVTTIFVALVRFRFKACLHLPSKSSFLYGKKIDSIRCYVMVLFTNNVWKIKGSAHKNGNVDGTFKRSLKTLYIAHSSFNTYKISVFHTVYMWSYNRKVFESLRWGSIWNVYNNSQVISYCSYPTFKGTRKCTFWKLKFKGKFMISSGHYWYSSFLVFIWNRNIERNIDTVIMIDSK